MIQEQKIIYATYQTVTDNQEVIDRTSIAQESIKNENLIYNNWITLKDIVLTRDGSSIGDTPLPFLKDMIEFGMNLARDVDIVVISNADICIIPNTTEKILKGCNSFGALCAHRYDFDEIPALLETEKDLYGREKYLGYDLFAFHKRWWLEKKDIFPDMILGRQAWDLIFARAVKENGGAELEYSIYHKTHVSPWNTINGLPGNDYNYRLALEWCYRYGGDFMRK
jgi:hypothetical protein